VAPTTTVAAAEGVEAGPATLAHADRADGADDEAAGAAPSRPTSASEPAGSTLGDLLGLAGFVALLGGVLGWRSHLRRQKKRAT
jgi:hypothetical protein